MAKRKLTARNPIRKRLHVSLIAYPPLDGQRHGSFRFVPYIRLRGHWLAAAGFSPADAIDVVVTPGRIVMVRA